MRAPNSLLSIRNIGVQLFPRQLDFFLDAYRKATACPYGYLLIDMHASSDPVLRLRTNIFKDEQEEDQDLVRRLGRARSERGARRVIVQKGAGVGGLFAALLTPVLIEVAKSFVTKNA
ncbi:hypothetical protein niasHT_018812 [Heterodera trifolii]|uniref:Uncharacterized protein n=1 Tax=Heterodera trifolii TaxID=157864 RepID=A0ABD2KZJ6_9BILA